MSTLFQELGDTVARQWEEANRNEDKFIEIAANALRDSQLLTRIGPEEIASWLVKAEQLPSQDIHEFGQPPINLYVGDGFYIQALFWIDGTTSIHEHSFVGAFGVLHGASVHSTYSFIPEKTFSDRLITGQVKFRGSELLSRGDIRSILSADRLIHALFHLDRPSVSIVVRTHSCENKERPQYYYSKPYLALNDHKLPNHQTLHIRLLESLWKSNRPLFWKIARQTAENGDPFMLFQALLAGHLDTTDSENWNSLVEAARRNRPELVDTILICLQEENRSERIRSLRNTVHDPTHRFFLGLLLNVPSREELFRLIAQRFPDENPVSLVVRWLGEIFAKEQAGVKLTRSWLFLIERMLEDPKFENSRDFLVQRFNSKDKENEDRLRAAWQRLRSFEFIKPLLTTTSAVQATRIDACAEVPQPIYA